MKFFQYSLIIVLFASLVSCDEMTDFSPYDANTSYRNLNATNILKNENVTQIADSLTFIAISDSHSSYSDLRAVVNSINKMERVSFVVVCGDVTNLGLCKEYEDYYNIIRKLNIPFITLIGNHDYLSNGKLIYNKMFGPTNFYFETGNYRMIMFDDIVWENGNYEPDFNWLQEALNTPTANILFMHIPLWDAQLENGFGDKLKAIIENNDVIISISGHEHGYKTKSLNNKQYLVLPDLGSRTMAKISLVKKTMAVEMINF
jgi:3',5'-cyclic-AMP phosphodiesterase